MKVYMLETVQGADVSGILVAKNVTVSILEKGEMYEVNATLGNWLLEHRKAQEAKETRKPSSSVVIEAEPEEVRDVMTTESQPRRGRRSK